MKPTAIYQSIKILCSVYFMLCFAHCNLNLERDPLQLISALGLVQPGGGRTSGEGATDGNDLAGFTLGGTVSGLSGTGLVLRLNSSEDLSVTANANFQFSTRFNLGQSYAVTVSTQPSNPTQSCTITNGSGTFAEANVSNISVQCLSIPVLSSINPANYSNLATNGNVVVRFSKTMNTGSCNLNPGLADSLLAGNAYTTTWTQTNLPNDTLTITPNPTWNVGLNRILRITNCADTDGLVAASGGSLDFDALFYITATPDALRYVATTGTDAGACTVRANPCATIEYAYGQLATVTDCGTNGDCAVLVGSGNYSSPATINIASGRSIIGSFDANFQNRNVFNSPTNILPTNINACGGDLASACRTIRVSNVLSGTDLNPGTRLETIAILGKEDVLYSYGLRIGDNSRIRLATVISRAGNSNVNSAESNGLSIEGVSIVIRMDTGIYTSGSMTGTGANSSAIRVSNSLGVNITMTGGVAMNLRDSPTRHGFYLTSSNNARVDMRFSGTNLTEDLTNTNFSYGFRMQGDLNSSNLVLGFNNIRSFSANQRSIGLFLDSGNIWSATPLPVIYNNQISGGRVNSAVDNIARGVSIQRFGGFLINNRIVGGSSTGADGDVTGLFSSLSVGLQLMQNSIASGSGSSVQSAIRIESNNTGNWNLFNNNFASNTNAASSCVNYITAQNPLNHNILNNNFHRCPGGHVRFNSIPYYRSNCAGTDGQEGNLSENPGCVTRLDTVLSGTVSGNIDVDASFQTADPNDLAVNVWDWNLNLLTNGTTPCVLARGGRALASVITNPINIQDVINIDRRNNTRTNTDTTGIANLPFNANGRSMGAYEFDGTCL